MCRHFHSTNKTEKMHLINTMTVYAVLYEGEWGILELIARVFEVRREIDFL